MLLIGIKDIKQFMNLLLTQNTFDDFSMVECTVKKYITYELDGHTNRKFLGEDETAKEDGEYIGWDKARPECLELIKGKRTPLYMKFILQKEPGQDAELPFSKEISSYILNITFSDKGLTLTTAVNLNGFYPDSDAPSVWDAYIERRLNKLSLKLDILK